MARAKHGPYGPIIGRLGNIVGYLRFGEPLLRMIGQKSTKPRTPAQLAVSLKFKVAVDFVTPINGFTNVGFKKDVVGTTKTAYNAAISYNVKNAVQGEYPEFKMDYSKAIVSKGNLPGAINPALELIEDPKFSHMATLKFTWEEAAGMNWDNKRDQVMMMAYLPDTDTAFFSLSGARRTEGADELQINLHRNEKYKKNDTRIETYIAFISDDRESISDSLYVGRIDL